MQYVLGNMLNGGGGLNADGLSLDLQFATDKTLTARKGPTPAFTRGSTGTFVGSDGLIQSAAINIPRFDHTSAGVCRGLLMEESRTNLILQSENFASASWTKSGGSISSVANVEPDGSANSELFSEDGATSTHRTFQSFTGVSGTSYTLSVFLKFAGRDQIFLENRSIGTNPFAVFNIQNGTIGFVSSGLTAAIQAYPNGWYRCSITGTATLAGGNYLIGGYSGGSQSYTGLNGPAFYLYGAQVEAGSFATSYIPTTTSSLTRSADVCSITGGDFTLVYNESEHTLFAEASAMSHANFGSYLGFDNGTANEQSSLSGFPSPNTAVCYVIDGGVTQANINRSITLNQNNKLVAAMKASSFQIAANGSLGTEDTSGTMPTATTLKIGRSWNSATISGTYAQIKVFKKRLANAKLQTLTV